MLYLSLFQGKHVPEVQFHVILNCTSSQLHLIFSALSLLELWHLFCWLILHRVLVVCPTFQGPKIPLRISSAILGLKCSTIYNHIYQWAWLMRLINLIKTIETELSAGKLLWMSSLLKYFRLREVWMSCIPRLMWPIGHVTSWQFVWDYSWWTDSLLSFF